MNYGKAVRTFRSARGLSQSQLSKTIGFDQSLVSRIESGKRKPSIKNLEAIAEKLSIPFHLIALLASEPKDLKGISGKEAQKLGYNLLKILVTN